LASPNACGAGSPNKSDHFPASPAASGRQSPFTIKKPQFFEPRKDFTLKNWKQIWRNIASELTCDELSTFSRALADDVARQELLAEVERALACRFAMMAQVAGSILAKLTIAPKGRVTWRRSS
jgi:hypothetical protein